MVDKELLGWLRPCSGDERRRTQVTPSQAFPVSSSELEDAAKDFGRQVLDDGHGFVDSAGVVRRGWCQVGVESAIA